MWLILYNSFVVSDGIYKKIVCAVEQAKYHENNLTDADLKIKN